MHPHATLNHPSLHPGSEGISKPGLCLLCVHHSISRVRTRPSAVATIPGSATPENSAQLQNTSSSGQCSHHGQPTPVAPVEALSSNQTEPDTGSRVKSRNQTPERLFLSCPRVQHSIPGRGSLARLAEFLRKNQPIHPLIRCTIQIYG